MNRKLLIHVLQRAKSILTIIFACGLVTQLTGCEKMSFDSDKELMQAQKNKENFEHLWARIRNNYQLQIPENNRTVNFYLKKYKQHSHHMKGMSHQAAPYLFHVVEALEARGMPGELAFLPMIESGYRPFAVSTAGATGIWQIGQGTGKHLGIKKNGWYDGRRDINESTKAALDYLEYLHQEFNGDWMMALAAYNCGPGRVKQAIRRNKRQGKTINYWNLPLPKQTRHYLPKLLALAKIISSYEEHNIDLKHIDNKPYFTPVTVAKQIDLRLVADMAGLPVDKLRKLNPGFNSRLTHPRGPHALLLPVANAKRFNDNYAKASGKVHKAVPFNFDPKSMITYKIKTGDSLSSIASQFNCKVHHIKYANNLSSDVIVAGKSLKIPVRTT